MFYHAPWCCNKTQQRSSHNCKAFLSLRAAMMDHRVHSCVYSLHNSVKFIFFNLNFYIIQLFYSTSMALNHLQQNLLKISKILWEDIVI